MVLETVAPIKFFEVNDKYLFYEYQQYYAKSEESFLGLGFFPDNEKVWFDLSTENPLKYSSMYSKDIYFALEFRLTSDIQIYQRSIYTFFDLLGDVGGLQFILTNLLGSFLMSCYTFFVGNPQQRYLLTSLLKTEKSDGANENSVA